VPNQVMFPSGSFYMNLTNIYFMSCPVTAVYLMNMTTSAQANAFNVNFMGCTFDTAPVYLYLDNGCNVYATSTTWTSAVSASGLYVDTADSVTVVESSFTGVLNAISLHRTAGYINDLQFSNCNEAFFSEYGSVAMSNVEFENNYAPFALFGYTDSSLYDVDFVGNYGFENVFVAMDATDEGGSLSVENVQFRSSNASNCVALFSGIVSATLSNSVFQYNYAENTLCVEYASVDLNSVQFVSNSAQTGGALSVYEEGRVNADLTNFYENYAAESGGAFYITLGGQVSATNCQITDNKAGTAGAYYCDDNGSTLLLTNTTEYGNVSQDGSPTDQCNV